jgi:hypothetical protein
MHRRADGDLGIRDVNMKPSIFCHVRKTGGTTLHGIFRNAAGADKVSPGHGSEQYSNALRQWRGLSVISQHIWFAPGEKLSKDLVNLTVLRDPVERVLSNYFYVRAQDGVFNPDALERRLSLPEFVSSELAYARAEAENFQTKLFSPIGLSPGESCPSPDRLLNAAKSALDQFEIVGLTERLAETVDLIAYVTGMKTVPVIPRERATDSRPSIENVPADTLRTLRDLNNLDAELYAYAAKRFATLCRRSFLSLLDSRGSGSCSTTSADPPRERAAASPQSSAADPQTSAPRPSGRFGTREVEIVSVHLWGSVSLGAPDFISGEHLSLTVQCKSRIANRDLTVGVSIRDSEGRLIYGTNTWVLGRSIRVEPDSTFEATFRFPLTLGTGRYHVSAALHTGNSHLDRCFDWYDDCASFGVVGVIGFHFEGLVSLVPSLSLQCRGGEAALNDLEQLREGYLGLGRLNRPIEKPEGAIVSIASELTVPAGDLFALELEIANSGDVSWEENGKRCVKLCYRWLAQDGSPVVKEGERSDIGGDLFPGESRRLWITVTAPLECSGAVILRVTLVQEHVAWFDESGKLYCDVPARILGPKE